MTEKHYKKGETTVIWKPSFCIHSANCVKNLPTECWLIICFNISTYSEKLTPNPRIKRMKKGIIRTIKGVRSAITGDEIL